MKPPPALKRYRRLRTVEEALYDEIQELVTDDALDFAAESFGLEWARGVGAERGGLPEQAPARPRTTC